MKRQRFLAGAGALAGTTLAPITVRAQETPLKFALLAPLSGPSAAAGHDMVNGWELYWKTHGDVVAGRRIVTTSYDTNSNPTRALEQVRRAIEQDGAQVVVGPYLANEGLAVAPYTESHKIPLILPTVSADDLSQRQPNPFVIKVAGWSSSLPTHPAGVWAYEQGYRRVVTIANNYAFGYENSGGFCQTFVERGGKVINQLWPPLGTTDYSPYISQVQAANADVVFACTVGADAVHFLEQWKSFGLKGKLPLIANETTTDQSNIRTIAPDVVEGIISFAHYAEGRADPATRDFVLAYGKAQGVLPSYMATACYTAAGWLSTALRNVKGNTNGYITFLSAIRNVRLSNSPLGPMRLDRYNAPIENVYIRKVVATSGPFARYAKTWNVVVKTYPNVSQFWTYKPADYLKQPSYSPSYQGYPK